MKKNKSVDDYFNGLEVWQEGATRLRKIILSTPVEETVKWGMPVYVAHGKNVFGIIAMKNYFGLWFYQGALLEDRDRVLINAQEGKTKAMRQWRFASVKDIKTRQIKSYLVEAIGLAAAGKEIKPDRNKPLDIPMELVRAFDAQPKAKQAFDQMSKSCRREYAEYIAEAKKEETKLRRIEKIIPMMLETKSLNDKYR